MASSKSTNENITNSNYFSVEGSIMLVVIDLDVYSLNTKIVLIFKKMTESEQKIEENRATHLLLFRTMNQNIFLLPPSNY